MKSITDKLRRLAVIFNGHKAGPSDDLEKDLNDVADLIETYHDLAVASLSRSVHGEDCFIDGGECKCGLVELTELAWRVGLVPGSEVGSKALERLRKAFQK
jgi:hypothetical protein